MVKKYGVPLLVTSDDNLKEYISTILSQVQGKCWISAQVIDLTWFERNPNIRITTDKSEWLLTSSLTRLVLAIKSIETDETLERWQFEIHTDEAAAAGGKPSTLVGRTETGGKKKEKTEKEVQGEIREIMKQITSTTTFLPILQEECKSDSQSRLSS